VLASQLAGFLVLRTWLLDRVDQQLTSFQPPSPAFLAALRASNAQQKEQTALPSDFRVFVYDTKGHLTKPSLGSKDKPGPRPRTPLTSIQEYAQLALRPERRTAEEEREAQRLIAQNAERMSLLVDDLQLLATLDKEPAYQSQQVDLLSLAADAVSSAAVHGRAHPVGLGPLGGEGEEAELDIVPAVGDPHRLRQIVENLLSNARVHTPPNTPVHVRVGVTKAGFRSGGTNRPGRYAASAPLPPGSKVAVLEVADEGPGLAARDAEHVFERFYRADPSRSRAHRGSGLGLAIAATIAEGHRGRLELDTASGRGCTFRLVLPAA
jgi:two-component system OmpR family sensor kinase